MRRMIVVVVMVCLALPMVAVPARADFGLVIGVLSVLFDLQKNRDNFEATAPMERSDTSLRVPIANVWWGERWVGDANDLETHKLKLVRGAVVQYAVALYGKPHLLGEPTIRLSSNQSELRGVAGRKPYTIERADEMIVNVAIDTSRLPTKTYLIYLSCFFTNGMDQAGKRGRGRVPHPDSNPVILCLTVVDECDIGDAINDPGVQKVLSLSGGMSDGVPVLSGPKFELSPEIVRETGLDAVAEAPPPTSPLDIVGDAVATAKGAVGDLARGILPKREESAKRSRGEQGSAQPEQSRPPTSRPQYRPPSPKAECPEIQIVDQPGPEPNVDASRLPLARVMQNVADQVGYSGHLLQYTPYFDASGCGVSTPEGKRITQPLVILFVNQRGELVDSSSVACIMKRAAGQGQFAKVGWKKRSLDEDGRFFILVNNAKDGEAYAPVYAGKTYGAIPVRAGCGGWYPVVVE